MPPRCGRRDSVGRRDAYFQALIPQGASRRETPRHALQLPRVSLVFVGDDRHRDDISVLGCQVRLLEMHCLADNPKGISAEKLTGAASSAPDAQKLPGK